MKKIYRYIKFYFKNAFRNITRHLGLTFSASAAVSITLALISVFMLISANITKTSYHIEDEITIRASIDTVMKEDDLQRIKQEIEAVNGVKKVSYASGEEELSAYQKEYKDENNLFSMYEGESSPIRDAYTIKMESGKNIKAANAAIRKIKGVVSAEYGGSSTDELMKGLKMVRDGSAIFIVFLLLLAIFLISNKIKMSIYTRKDEIAIMRFVGTSNTSVKLPMMLEGMIIGFLGALLPIILTVVSYQYIYTKMNGTMVSEILTLQPVFPLVIYISLVLIGLGMLVGLCGGFISTTRYLHLKR